MLTSEKRMQVAEAAEAIEAAASKVRALLEDEPDRRAEIDRRAVGAAIVYVLSEQRRRLLGAWSE